MIFLHICAKLLHQFSCKILYICIDFHVNLYIIRYIFVQISTQLHSFFLQAYIDWHGFSCKFAHISDVILQIYIHLHDLSCKLIYMFMDFRMNLPTLNINLCRMVHTCMHYRGNVRNIFEDVDANLHTACIKHTHVSANLYADLCKLLPRVIQYFYIQWYISVNMWKNDACLQIW